MNFVCSKAVCKVFFQRLLKNVLCPARRPFWPPPAFVFGGVPPPGPTSCTCRPRHEDGARRAKYLKRESFRTSTVQMHHQDRRGTKIPSVLFEFVIADHVWLSLRRPVCSVQRRFFRKRVFLGGGGTPLPRGACPVHHRRAKDGGTNRENSNK